MSTELEQLRTAIADLRAYLEVGEVARLRTERDALAAEVARLAAENAQMRTAILKFEKQSYLGWTRGQFDEACRELAEAAGARPPGDAAGPKL